MKFFAIVIVAALTFNSIFGAGEKLSESFSKYKLGTTAQASSI